MVDRARSLYLKMELSQWCNMKTQVQNKINTIFSAKGCMGKIPNWFAKEAFKDVMDYSEYYTRSSIKTKQDKSSFVTISNTNTDITLEPNKFTILEGIRSALHILLQEPSDGTIPVYNCHFTLGVVAEENFSVDSYFGYDVLWARKDTIEPCTEYGLYVHGNIAWLVANPIYVIEATYDVKKINSATMLYNTESDKGGSSAANSDSNVRMLVDGVVSAYESTYHFKTKGEHTVHYCFKYFPSMTRRFDDCTDIKSIKLYFVGEEETDCFASFYGNTLSSFDIVSQNAKLNITDASLMFNNCYKLTDDKLNPALRKMSGNNPPMLGMLDGCHLLETVDLTSWDCDGSGILGLNGHVNQILFKGNYSDYLWGTVDADDNGEMHPIVYFSDNGYVKKVNTEKGELPYKDLTFYSLDKIIASYTKEEALLLTELPVEPKHSNEFSFNGWSHTLDEIKSSIENFGYCNVIAKYTNLSDYHTLIVGNQTVTISFTKDSSLENGGVKIEWGDGDEETVTDTGDCSISHTYASQSENIIKIYPNGETIYNIEYTGNARSAFPSSIYISSRSDNGAPVTYTRYFEKNEKVSINLTFWMDSNSQGNYSTLGASVAWGDGSQGSIACEFGTASYSVNHVYTTPGTYTITLSGSSHSAAYCHGGASISCSEDIPANILKDVKYAEGITEIKGLSNVIPSTVTTINSTYNMNAAVSTFIPETVTTINGSISAHKLEAVVFEGNLPCTFTNCPILTFVDTANKDVTFGINMNSLRYVDVDSSATELPLYTNYFNLRQLTIPEGITSIQDSQFNGCYKLKNVVLPETITNIGNNAFAQCSISEINIPSGVTELNNTFRDVRTLENVTLNSGLTTIGPNTFYNTGLTNLVLPDTVVTIGDSAFEQSTLQDITIPESVTSIGENAFKSNNYISSLIIPNSVTSIGVSAFSSMEDLGEITLSSNLTAIPDKLCENCTALTSFTVPKSVETIGSDFITGCPISTLKVDENNIIFDSRDNCNGILETDTNKLVYAITDTIIPETCEILGSAVFEGTKRNSITIPDSVIEIEDSVFSNLSTLITVNGCNNVKKIGDYAFYYTNISSFNFENVEEIGRSSFASTDLTSISLPNIKKIGASAFDSCSSFTSINTPSLNDWCNVEFGGYLGKPWDLLVDNQLVSDLVISNEINKINDYAFIECKSLTSVSIIGDTIIGNNAFRSCPNLTSVSISGNVGVIGSYAFNNCTKLTSVTMSEGVTGISERTFDSCDALESISLPNSVTTIPGYSISYCDNLKSITLGTNTQKIENYAFCGCGQVNSITCHALVAPVLTDRSLYGVNSVGVLYCPLGSDYSTWIAQLPNWTIEYLYTPTECVSLSITADDVAGRKTNTVIHYTAITNGVDSYGNAASNITVTGDAISHEFDQNLSETETVERTITFEYLGKTASTTITHGVYVPTGYTIDLNSQWQKSTVVNPDSTLYDGVYESFSNKDSANTAAIMYIDIVGYDDFKFYVRSYAESSYDFVVVSNLDCTLSNNTTSGSNVKMTTSGKQNNGTAIDAYQLVEFTGIDGGEHRISVMYRKDSGGNSYDDRGYVLIPKNQ